MPLHVEIIAAEQPILTIDVEVVVATTVSGQISVLPQHEPLLTLLAPGELRLGRGANEMFLALAGGYLEVRDDHVTILADAAERAEDIDVARAEGSRERATARLREARSNVDVVRASSALARAVSRLKAADRYRSRGVTRSR
ncbi:MAG: F0F1 ATP synthase subunit epsilon [Chloroflexi bacterium]|nr:F0F1 ATP synthase subunit epsilon [Chloroflexota bacterium]